jgi:hypothetical protein
MRLFFICDSNFFSEIATLTSIELDLFSILFFIHLETVKFMIQR